MAQVRRRVKHALTFEERLAEEARRLKEEAETPPWGARPGTSSCVEPGRLKQPRA